MTLIVNHALLYNGDTSYTLQQASTGTRMLLLIAIAFDWYGNDATLSCSVEDEPLTPLASYLRASESSNCNTAVYALTDAELPAEAGEITVAFLSAYYSRLAIVELANAPQNPALLTISNAAVTAGASSAAIVPVALDLVISALGINLNNTITGLAPTALLGIETSTGSETRFALGAYAAPSADPVTVGFSVEYGSTQPGSLTTIRIPVLAQQWLVNPDDDDASTDGEAGRWLVGSEWFIAPTDDDAYIDSSAPGWQQSDVGVTRNVVDPDGDPISSRISVLPANGTADLSLSGNLVYYPFDDLSTGDVFTVEPWSNGLPSPNTFQVTILHDETAVAPQFDTLPLLSVTEGSQYNYAGTVSDENGDAITLSALIKPAWLTFTQTGADSFTLVGTPPVEDVNTYQVRLRAGDEFLAGYQDYSITVLRAPFFTGANEVNWNNWSTGTLQLTSNTPGAVFSLFSPPAGITINGSGLVSGALTTHGDVTFLARVTHGGRTRDRVITAHINGRPIFYNDTTLNLSAPGAIEPITIEAQDPEGAAITMTALQVPAGLAFVPVVNPQTTGNGEVYTGIFTGVLAAGIHTATVRAATASSGTSDHTIVITVAGSGGGGPVDLPPTESGDYTGQTATVGVAFSFDASTTFDSPDNDPISYSAYGLPPGLGINATTGAISGTPTLAGFYDSTIYAADPDLPLSSRVSAQLPITVNTAGGGTPQQPGNGNNDMGQAIVIVNNLNLAQGSFPEIERKALFIGVGATNVNELQSINTQSDLDDLLGAAASELKTNVLAAKNNGGESWMCYAIAQAAGYDLEDVVNQCLETISPEFIVVCTPSTTAAQLDGLQTLAEALRTAQAKRVIIVTATPGINPATQTWSQYEAAQAAITDDVAAYRVAAVPQLHGNDLGCVMGRLCNHSVSIADSPMRVATGPILGLGATPVDSAGRALSGATLATLDDARLSCIQRYTDYPGTYWSDLNLLDVPAGDFQVVENLRVMDKAARAVRILAIARVANRSFNNTPPSIAANKTYFSRPLREMSHSTSFAGETFPGEIMAPESDAVSIVWPTRTSVEVYLKLQPYNCPKRITANLVLDLSGQL